MAEIPMMGWLKQEKLIPHRRLRSPRSGHPQIQSLVRTLPGLPRDTFLLYPSMVKTDILSPVSTFYFCKPQTLVTGAGGGPCLPEGSYICHRQDVRHGVSPVSSYKDTNPIQEGSTLMTQFISPKALPPNTITITYGIRFQHMNFEGTQYIP